MDVPALPTDNLYKFMALAGLIAVLASYVIPLARIPEILIKQIETNTDYQILKLEINALDKEVDALGKEPGRKPEHTARLRERILELRIKDARVTGSIEKNKVLEKDLGRMWTLLAIGNVIGFLVSGIGFILWYVRVQKQNDLLLLKQTK